MSWVKGIEKETEKIFCYPESAETPPDREWIYLDKNENHFLSKSYLERVISRCIREVDLRRYPVEEEVRFKEELCNFLSVSPTNVVMGNGCSDLINILCHTFLREGSEAVVVEPTFSMYRWNIERQRARLLVSYLKDDFSLTPSAVTSRMSKNSRLCFISSPNNPTGNKFGLDEILEIGLALPGLLAVDETYVEFSDGSCIDLLGKLENLVILRSFSKIGFAGIRLGYAITTPRIASLLKKFIRPYSIDSLSLRMGIEILGDYEPVRRAYGALTSERQRFESELKTITGVTPYPSQTNFILIKLDKDTVLISRRLKDKGIIVKDLHDYPLLYNHLRVTVGTPEMNEVFLSGLRRVMES
ncbi:MAG: aminotransferase class I/II-fold pyridoxal phosphate-dependent enzyme [Nitrososphaeria archaeon]|nr:aminotransferase class I/II-fold pyridoxal phosphate-dependent enzyme [Nitrososphaeria archaeon]NIN53657.1 aminotransferase class I/II-fold pyridoxal phosphate-dependent enzyme [Nitrososphaeria archaeon]NIQ34190.1 aminotransferase class I/II-fold pyridoxal phosphate-dependent enzyme [Nitrososphaeria archaeon]